MPWISQARYDKMVRTIADQKVTIQELEAINKRLLHNIDVLANQLSQAQQRIRWLEQNWVTYATCLIFEYTIDNVTFKSSHMSLSLPAGKQVTLTIKGTGKDAQGNVVEAPVTGASLSVSGPGLGVSQNTDGSFTLKYISDDTGTITATAKNSLGTSLSGTDPYTTGGGTPPSPVVADTLTFNYGPITDITA